MDFPMSGRVTNTRYTNGAVFGLELHTHDISLASRNIPE